MRGPCAANQRLGVHLQRHPDAPLNTIPALGDDGEPLLGLDVLVKQALSVHGDRITMADVVRALGNLLRSLPASDTDVQTLLYVLPGAVWGMLHASWGV